MTKKKDIWDQIITNLRSHISQREVKTLFSHTTLRKLDPSLAVIEVPNKFIATWLVDNYIDNIKTSFKHALHFLPEIRFTYPRPSPVLDLEKTSVEKTPAKMRSPNLDPSRTFDTFITANCNRFAYSSALEVAHRPGAYYNPLYIFSNLSLGKTHLLHAIGNHVVKHQEVTNVTYLSADQFTSEFSLGVRNRNLSQFRDNFNSLDLLLLDDVHLLAGRTKTQEELISLFNSFYDSKRQLVMAANMPPNQIQNLLPRLTSRLEWGLLSEMQVYDQETKMKIVSTKAEEQNLTLPEDVTFFLANATNDLKTLVQYLVSLQTYASLYHQQINISTVKSVTNDRHFHKISIRDIQKVTAEHFNISLMDLLSNKKSRKFAYPRQVAMYLSRNLTKLSYNDIGKAFGNKNHSTVIYSVKRIQCDKDLNRGILDDIIKLQGFISQRLP